MIVKQSWHHYLDISLSGVNISKYTNNKNVINDLVEEYLRKERAEREAQQQLNSGSTTPSRGGSGIRSSRISASSSMDSDVIYMSDEESSMSEREDTASQPCTSLVSGAQSIAFPYNIHCRPTSKATRP